MLIWPFSVLQRRIEARDERIMILLRDNGELTGYEIGHRLKLGPGTMYATLQRLERTGRLASRWGLATAERGWHRPRLYRVR